MGTRTKYQTFLTPQLIVEAHQEDDPFYQDLPNANKVASANSDFLPVDQPLDEETILLNKPNLSEAE